jgi:hypothetical protein
MHCILCVYAWREGDKGRGLDRDGGCKGGV